MSILAVVPILPTLASLFFLLPVLALSALAGLASLFRPAVALLVWRLIWRQKLPLLVLISLACVAAPAASWLETKFRMRSLPDVATGSAWSTSRGTLARRGWADDQPGPVRGARVWSAGRPGEAFYASPAVVGNRVYCVGSRGDTGMIYGWDAETGTRVWSSAPRGYRATFSSPVVSGRYLVCGEGLHRTAMARVVCIDLAPGREGVILWTFSTNSHVECTPFVDVGRAYVGAGDDGIYCLRLDPGIPASERVLWHAPGARYPDAETSLAVFEGKVYVGLGQEGQAVCVLDAESGKELSRVTMPFPVFSPPAIQGGKLFVGMGTGDYVHQPEEPAGQVCCLDLRTLRIEWSFATGGTVLGAIAAADGQIVFGCADGYVYALTQDGRLLGKWNSRAPVLTSPAVTKDRIYLVNQAGMLYALDRRRLESVWELRLGRSGRFMSSPAIARGHVYVGTEADGFVCAGEPHREPHATLWPGHLGGAGATGCRDGSLLPSDAAVRWDLVRAEPDASSMEVTGPIAATPDGVLVPVAAGSQFGLACVEPSHDARAVEAREPDSATENSPGSVRWFFETPNAVVLSPAVSAGRALAVDGRPGDAQRHVFGIDMSSGRLVWKWPVDADASGVLTASQDSLFVQDASEALRCLSLDGQERWRRPFGPICQAVDASTAILVAAVESPPGLVAIDRASGAVLWRKALDSTPTTAPAVQKDRLCLGTDAGVEARRLVDGRRVWQLAGEIVTAVYHAPDRCVFVNANGELIIADAATGRVMRRSAAAAPGSVPLVAANGIVVVANGHLQRLGVNGEPAGAPAFGPKDLGTPVSPLVAQDGCVYLGVRGRGMICIGGKPGP